MEILTELAADTFNITLNDPERRNAQTPQTWDELYDISQSIPKGARFIVLRGNGKSFSAGLDRAMFTPEGVPGQPSFIELADRSDAELDDTIAHYKSFFGFYGTYPKSVSRWFKVTPLGRDSNLRWHAISQSPSPTLRLPSKKASMG